MNKKEVAEILDIFNQREMELSAIAHALLDIGGSGQYDMLTDQYRQHDEITIQLKELRRLRALTTEAMDDVCFGIRP